MERTERIEVGRMRGSERLSGRGMRSIYRISLAAINTLSMMILMLVSLPALAATSLNFVTDGGQFSIANGELTFTNDLTISVATVDGNTEPSLIGATVELDPIPLSANEITPIGSDVVQIGVTAGQLTLSIRRSIDAGGALLATATFIPGDLRVFFGTSGELSSEMVLGPTGFILEPAGSASNVLSSFATTADPIALDLTLSAAGQDIAALFAAGSPVTGSAGGSMAILVPEPSTTALTGAAMTTLLFVTGLRRRGRRIEPPSA